ncbi:ABC transporter permease subunit [Myceligenerans cantabricum]
MSPDVLRHDLSERRTGVLVLGLALGALSFFALAMSIPMADMLDAITDNLTPALQAFLGADTPGGYVVGEVFNLIAPIAVVAYAVAGGASILAGEEQGKTMGMLFSHPVSRASILWAKAGTLALALTAAVAIFWAGLALGSLLFDVELSLAQAGAGSVHLLFLGLAFGMLAFAVAAATGRPQIASATAGTIAVIAYFMQAMLPLAGYDTAAEASPWYYYLGSDPLNDGVDLVHLFVLAGIAAIALAVAAWAFPRRDLKG